MKRNCFMLMVMVFFALSIPAYADQTAEEILKAIVKIRATVPKEAHTASTLGTEREGNGVVIDSKGHILTIGYLIVEADTIEVVGPEDKPIKATFVGYDHSTGFGLLKTDKPLGVPPMKIGKSSTVKEGDPVIVGGHGGSDAVQAVQVISRKEFAGYWEYLLDDAISTFPAYPNFAGAALISRDGQLLGIGSLFSQVRVQGFGAISCNIFVPIDLLNPILDDLITKGRSSKPSKPWLGINVEETHGRIFITQITSGGPAELAGLQRGDLILTVKGDSVSGLADFYRKVWALGNAGAEIPLTILQGTRIRDITVRSSDRYKFLLEKPKKI